MRSDVASLFTAEIKTPRRLEGLLGKAEEKRRAREGRDEWVGNSITRLLYYLAMG